MTKTGLQALSFQPTIWDMKNFSYFRGSIIGSVIGLALAFAIGYWVQGGWGGAFQFLFLAVVLGLLELSISFDNAVVNASVLKDMTPLWQRRFLTWGILIAVFGMRLIFPLLIVCLSAWVGPWEALKLATFEPQKYADMMLSVHHEVSAFGGAFLMLVALKFFFDPRKELHWIPPLERRLAALGKLGAVEVGLTLALLWILSKLVPSHEAMPVLVSGIGGILTYLAVDALGVFLEAPGEGVHDIHRASMGMFIYLEVLDASFSFDGVVGAFAITNNLYLICIGLGIGALFVRSLTIMMVQKGALEAFRYLEHGAFYAVASLAVIMLANTILSIPEIITGTVGITLIGLSVYSSLKEKN